MTDEQHQPAAPAAEVDGTDEVAEVVVDTGGPSLRTALEAILMVVDEPVGEVLLAQVTEQPTEDGPRDAARARRRVRRAGRGFELREVAGGWRFYTRASAAAYVERFVLDGQQARLTQAALETLAVVAYRQPVSAGRGCPRSAVSTSTA